MTEDLEILLEEWEGAATCPDPECECRKNNIWDCRIKVLIKALRVYRGAATAIINEYPVNAIQPDGNRISYLKHLAKEAQSKVQSILMGGAE